jgi:AcrR family transcriptional regulator
VPKLWTDTVETHREAVREAIIHAVHAQLHAHGLAGITMSGIAQTAGIGRATLYKYFPDVQSILDAAHDQHVGEHVAELRTLAHSAADVGDRLASVLAHYLNICTERARHGDADIASLLHRPEVVSRAYEQLLHLFTKLLTEAANAGVVRDDTPPVDLARFCLQSLASGDPQHAPADSPLLRLTRAGIAPRACLLIREARL